MSDEPAITLEMLFRELRERAEGQHKMGNDPKRKSWLYMAADTLQRLADELAAANEAREKAERERDEARENARVRSGEALDYYSAMLNLAHEFDAKDGDNMIEVIGNGIDTLRAEVERLREDAERYRWLRQPDPLSRAAHIAVLTRTGGWVASGDQCDAAIDAARKG